MNHLKMLSIVFLSVVLTLQLCDTKAIKFELDYTKFTYPKEIQFDGIKKSAESYVQHTRQPRSVNSDNSTVLEKKEYNASTTMVKSEIKIVDQKYSQNASGEYKHEVLFSNSAWRAEQGEFEDHNGIIVFVIRGVFSYFTKEGTYNTTLYIVDEFGYHNVQPPPQIIPDGGGMVDYIASTSEDCGRGKETYCIDPKLLALLVG